MSGNKRIVFAVCLMIVPRVVSAWNSVGPENHRHITDDAINALGISDYPDLFKYKSKYVFPFSSDGLVEGSADESSHYNALTKSNEWDGPRQKWVELGTESYKTSKFIRAYDYFGFHIHLIQDSFVPAHISSCPHGVMDYKFHDAFEDIADEIAPSSYKDEVKSKTNWEGKDAQGYKWPYWLGDDNDDDNEDDVADELQKPYYNDDTTDGPVAYSLSTTWGSYGRGWISNNPSSSNKIPGNSNRMLVQGKYQYDQVGDWYDGTGESANIAREQLYKAYLATKNELESVSKGLPPLVRNLKIITTYGGTIPEIDPVNGNKISFEMIENRKEWVTLYITVDKPAGEAGAKGIIDPVYRTGKTIKLGVSDGDLPWAGNKEITWTGILEDGAFLPEGSHDLYVTLKDADGNVFTYAKYPFKISLPKIIIQHTDIWNSPAGLDIHISAAVSPAAHTTLKNVQLFYRKAALAGFYAAVPMTHGEDNVYSGNIPASQVTSDGVEYFIAAEDMDGDIVTHPANIIGPLTSYTGSALKVSVIQASNGGLIVRGDADTENDSATISFYLGRDVPVYAELYKARKDWISPAGGSALFDPSQLVRTLVATGGVIGKGSFNYSPGIFDPASNYVLVLRNSLDPNDIVLQNRLLVLDAFAGITVLPPGGGIVAANTTGIQPSDLSFFKDGVLASYIPATYNNNVFSAQVPVGVYTAASYITVSGVDIPIGYSGVSPLTRPMTFYSGQPSVEQYANLEIPVSVNVFSAAALSGVSLTGSGASGLVSIPLVHSGGSVYSGVIPPQSTNSTFKFYFVATDINGNQTYTPQDFVNYKYQFKIVPDITPPQITETVPQNAAVDIPPTDKIIVSFSEEMLGSSLNENTVSITEALTGKAIAIKDINYSRGEKKLTFKGGFLPDTKYKIEIKSGAKDMSGNPLTSGTIPDPWVFTTVKVLPPAITGIKQDQEHFNSTTQTMVFSADVSRTIGQGAIILRNPLTQDEFKITVSLEKEAGTGRVLFKWDGKDNEGNFIPEGEYVPSFEVVDSQYGMVGSSEFQQVEILLETLVDAEVGFKQKYDNYWESAYPNYPQNITINYNYDSCLGCSRIHASYDGTGNKLGTWSERNYGGSGTEVLSVSGTTPISFWGGDVYSEKLTVFWRRKVNEIDKLRIDGFSSSRHFYPLSVSVTNGVFKKYLTVNRSATESVPVSISPTVAGKSCLDYYAGCDMEVQGYQIVSSRIKSRDDFDGNPEVETYVPPVLFVSQYGGRIEGELKVRNTSPSIPSFLVDRQNPTVNLAVDVLDFSPGLTPELKITATATDNLTFSLPEISLRILNQAGALVKTLYTVVDEAQGTKNVVWDGKGSNEYNGGQVVSDGIYVVKLSAKDKAGNSSETSALVTVDNTLPLISAPSITIAPATHPSPDVFTSNDTEISVKYTGSDNLSDTLHTVLTYTSAAGVLAAKDESDISVSPSAKNFAVYFDGKDAKGDFLADGVYDVVLTVIDKAGNKREVLFPKLKIDRSAPLANVKYVDYTIFTPDDGVSSTGDGYKDRVTLNYELSAPALVEINIQDSLGRILSSSLDGTLKTAGTYPWNGKIGSNFVADGSYVLKIKISDEFGNQTVTNTPVIKNTIPAQFKFPAASGSAVGGVVTVKGVASDPGINNTAEFTGYQVWYREGGNIDYSQIQNNPANPDPAIWKSLPVPPGNQSPADLAYPNATRSARSVVNGVLATWDTTALQTGTIYTVLLAATDSAGVLSFDSREVTIDQALDNSKPVVTISAPSITVPPPQFNIISEASRLNISCSLTQQQEKKADIAVEIFKILDPITKKLGNIVFRKDFLGQTSGDTISWNGRDYFEKYVETGDYRVKVTARDSDNIGLSMAEADIKVNAFVTEPFKIEKFEASNFVLAPGGQTTLKYTVSKEAFVTIKVFDSDNNLVQVLTEAVRVPAKTERQVIFNPAQVGLFSIQLEVVSVDNPDVKENATISIAVTAGGTANLAEIVYPQENAVLQGNSNFNWVASGQGEYYPPQTFTSKVRASGKEAITTISPNAAIDTLTGDFELGTKKSVGAVDNALQLAAGENQSQVTHDQFASPSFCSSNWFAQGFYSRVDGTIKRGEIYYRPACISGGTNSATFELRDDNNGTPGTILKEASLGAVNCLSSGYYGADLNVEISENVRYWIAIKTRIVGYSSASSELAYGTTNDNYGRGESMATGCPFSWYRPSVKDFAFNVVMAPYAKSGTFTSRTFDAGIDLDHFGNFDVLQQKNGQTVSYKTQSSDNGTTFDPPLTVLPGEQIPSTKKRYIRWLAELTTQDQNYSPVIQEAKLNYSNIQIQTMDFAVDKSLSGPAFVTYYNHPTLIPETPGGLSSLIPELAPKDVVDGPYYNILEAGNSYVIQSITAENGAAQLKAVTSVKEPWSTGDDQSLAGGKFGKADAVFNNETNPESFNVEAPYDFNAKTVRPIVFSSGYPAPDMTKNASIKNKYLFWKDGSGNIVDNPYTSIPSGGFGVGFMYLDNTGNPELALNKLQEKASNSNTDPQGTSINIDDEFSVRMAAGAAPRVFVELRGNTSTANQGFKSYSLAYKKANELVYRAITVKNSNSPVSANGTLGFWDVTGLNGEYNVKLIVLDANGIRESERKVNIGKVVPGQTPAISPPVFVNAPWNKAFLEFPDDCLLEQAVVSITPVKPVSLNIALNSSIPQPIGAVYDLQPSGIKFKDPANNPAYLTVRFTSEEMAGIDPAHLTIYEISSEGVLEPLDARVTYDQNGNGQLDAGEIVTVRSPVRHFSYFMIVPEVPAPQLDALPGITNSESVPLSGRAEPNSSVEIFLNGVLAQTLKTDSSGKIENAGLQLTEGKNIITARAIRRLNENIRKYSGWTAQVIVEKDSTLGQIENVTFPRTFKPQLGESGTLTYSLAKEMVINLSIKKENNEVVKSLLNATSQVPGKYSIGWNGIGGDGLLAVGGKYIFDLRGVDAAGNEIKANFGPFELIKDTVPPLTSITVGQPKYSGEYLYISTASLLSFVSVDNPGEIGGASGLGVGGTKISLAPPVYIDYLLPFSLTDGRAYSVSYFSFDVAGNTESVKNSTFVLDPAPPVTSMQINGTQYFDNSTNIVYLTDTSEIGFLAEDVQIGSLPGSGVKSIEYSLNPLAPVFNTYSSTFSLPTGEYLIAFNSTDKVLNRENIHISSLVVDGMEPLINVGFDSDVRRLPNGVLHISQSNAVMEIRITDQPSFGSGIKASSLEINGVSENIEPELSKPLGLGRNYVAIKTEDNLGNKAEKIFEVVVGDLLPPTDLKPVDGFITNKSSVTFSWTAPTTTYYSLTEYDLHFSKQKNFVNSEFEQFVSSHVKVTVLITEAGMVVEGLESYGGAYRLITEQIPDHIEGTLEGIVVTPFIGLPSNTTGISSFTVTQSLNGGEITHEYRFMVYQNYQYNPQPGPYSQITAGGGMTYDFPMGGAISFRSKLKRAALTDESPVLVKIEFTVNYLVAIPYLYCYKPCYYCSYRCYPTYYYDPRSYQQSISGAVGTLEGLRANGEAVALITDDIVGQSTGPIAGTWLSPSFNVPEQAFKLGNFSQDFDSNEGEILFEFSKNSSPFESITGIPLINFSPGDTIQFKASFTRNTPNDISPVLRGIAFDFVAPPPTEKVVSIPAVGRYYWKIRSKDGFGRYSDFSEESSFMYDSSAPEIIVASPTVNAKYLAGQSNMVLGFTAQDESDPSPRVTALLNQTVDLGRPREEKPAYLLVSSKEVVNLTDLDDGIWELLVEARDWAGNISTKSSGAFEIMIDTLPTVSSASVSGIKGQNDWYVSPVTVVLTSTDNLTGVEKIFYSLENITSNGQIVSLSSGIYSGPLTASEEGLYSGHYYARDKFGNVEPEKNISFKVDFDLPLVVAVGSPVSNVYAWNKTPVTAIFKGADTASGIAYCVPDRVLLTEGSSQTVSGYCLDYAGFSSTRTLTVNIDTTAPSVLYTQVPIANEYDWNGTSVTVKFTCADTLSGVRSCPSDISFAGEGVNTSTSTTVFDYADNSNTISIAAIKIDKTLPVSSAALAGIYKNGWYSSAVSFTITSTDSLSGVKEALYSLNGAAYAPYQQPVAVSADGSYTGRYYSRDKAGNAEAEKSIPFSIDRTAPQVGYTLNPKPNSYGWNNSSVEAVFKGTETLSGMDICTSSRTYAEGLGKTLSGWCRDMAGNIAYSTAVVNIDISSPAVTVVANPAANSNSWNNTAVTVAFSGSDAISGNFSCTADQTVSSEGVGQIITGSCSDYAGNSRSTFRAVNIDKTSPVTTAGLSGTLVNGWYGTTVSITLGSIDSLSGVERINYRLERSGVLISSGVYVAPLGVSADGLYTVYYYGTDKAGNTELEKFTAFKIDRTLPQASYTLMPAANASAWNNTAVQIVFNGTDTLSGVVECSSKIISTEGQTQSVVGWCRDTAGNISYSTAIINVDLTTPVVSIGQTPAKNGKGWNNTSVTAAFAGTDALSGIAYCEPAKIMSNEGSGLTVSGYCRDYAGLSSTATLTLSIDKTKPVTTGSLSGTISGGWYNTAVSITLGSTDSLSGVDRTNYRLERGGIIISSGVYGAPVGASTDGLYTVYYYSTDKAGNAEAEKYAAFKIDRTLPQVSYTLLPAANGSAWNNTTVQVIFSGTDTLSGIVECSSKTISTEGQAQAVAGWCRDTAGNIGNFMATVNVDLTKPVSIATQNPAPNLKGWNNTNVGVTFTGSDILSGLLYCSPEKILSAEGGSQTASGYCMDYAGNSSTATLTLNIDKTSPVIIISSPAAGDYFVATKNKIIVSFAVTDNLDPAPKAAAMLRQLEDRGSPRGGRPAAIVVVAGQQIEPLDIDDGIWRLTANATDFADNVSSATGGLFEVVHDVLSPRSALAAGAGSYQGSGQALYVTGRTTFTLTSIDDLVAVVDGIGLGVKKQVIGVNAEGRGLLRGLAFENIAPVQGAAFISTFKLDQEIDGAYNLAFNSEDVLSNVEKIKISTFIVDNTPPQTVFARVSGPAYLTYVSTWTLFELAPADPGSFASGVKETAYNINSGAVVPSPLRFNLPGADGNYLVKYLSKDNVENLEVEKSSQVFVDAAQPFSALAVIGGKQYPGAVEGSFYASLASKFGFTAADPIVGGGASGVKIIESADNGGTYGVYSQPISLDEGKHTITYRATDRVENTEVARSTQIYIDNTAPVTSFDIAGPLNVKDGVRYITPVSALTFSAADPVSKEVAAGVERIETAVDGGQWTKYTQTLRFVEGRHTIKYRAMDNVGNVEAERIIEVQSDNTAPISNWSVSSGDRIERGNKFYLNVLGRIALGSVDPVIGDVASGVEGIYYGIDAVPAEKYAVPIGLAEGVRTVKFSAKDNVGNTEVVKSTVIYVDGTKPVTELSLSGDQYKSDRQYISRRTDIVIAAADPVVSDVSVGVKETKYSVDGGVFSDYSPFKLPAEGRRLVSFYSADHVNNVEAQRTAELWVDGTAPLSVLDVLGGSQYPGAEPGSFYASLATKFGFVSVDPVVNDGAAGVKAIEYADNGGTSGIFAQPLSLGEGKHSITYLATDRVENTEVFRSTQIYIDNTAPGTSFTIAGPLYIKDGIRHITQESELILTSADPLVSEVSAGVERIETAVDGGQWLKYTQALKFAEGRHTVKYRAIDNVGNIEAERVFELRSDSTPPVTTHHIGTPYYLSGAGVNYITPETPLTFSASDPVTSDVASDVERIETSVDSGSYTLYTAALKFPEGRHTIKYRAYDNVGNLEAAHTLEVQSDSTAPESRWLPASGPWIEKDNKFYLNALGNIALESADPVRNNVAAGLENIYYGIDAAPSVKYLASFSLAEGVRTINYSAKDNVANAEVVKSTVIYVDGTKPVTGLSLSGDQYNGDKQYISQRTDIVITAADPVVNSVAVGVKGTKYSVDGAAFVNYSLFKLGAEGKRLVSYYSTDFVSNIETIKTTALWVDNTPPATELSIAGARYTAPGDEKLYITRDSGIVLTSSDPVSNDTASGVMLTKYRIDTGNWLVYSGSFTIAAEGLHTLEYSALDRVQNVETLKSAKIAVDNTPPVTGISLGEPKSEVFGLPVLMQNTPITLTAADPVMNLVSAGLNSIFYELENVQTGVRSLVAAYTSPFTITEQGTFIIRYWSKDNTGNTETPKEKVAAVTSWRADGLIAASGLDMSGTADISGSVKSNAIVSLGGNARILGDVTASTITMTGKAQITGLQVSGATPVNPAPIYLAGIVQNAAAVNNNALVAAYLADGKLILSSKVNLILSTGTYYFKGMDLSGGSSITVSGKVDILVEGGITINGGSSMNAAGEASKLSIIVSTASELKFNGGAALAACVYAPYSDLKLTGNALLGGHYFVKSAAVSGTGNLLQSGESLPVAAAPTGGGPKTKAAAMSGTRVGVLAGPDPEFRLGEVYVFPNPAKGTEAPVFHIEVGIADSVKITIYTISGRMAHEYTLTGLPIELDDGNGLSYAYEYTWRGHIPSGVYLYSIEARKAGQTLKKTGKFGVVR